jgi:hypothetical protein
MAEKCISGKKVFTTQQMAEDVLLELWTKNNYTTQHSPIAVYRCDECGFYHLTSRAPMNEKLSTYLNSSKFKLDKEASKWTDKFKNR